MASSAKTPQTDTANYPGIGAALALLRDLGVNVPYSFDPEFDLGSIAVSTATAQVRTDLIDKNHRLNMVESMRRNKDYEWPPILVWKPKNSTKYDVLDGLHRRSAANMVGRKTFPALVLDLSGQNDAATTAQSIKVAANTRNGLPTSSDENMTNALHLIETGISASRAAQIANVNKQTLINRKRSNAVLVRIVHNGLTGYENYFAQDALLLLSKITNDGPFREAAVLAKTADLPGPLAKDLFIKCAALKDYDKQMAFLAEMREQLASEIEAVANGAPRQAATPTVKAFRKLERVIHDQFAPDVILSLLPTPAARMEHVDQIREMRDMLTTTIRKIERADKDHR